MSRLSKGAESRVVDAVCTKYRFLLCNEYTVYKVLQPWQAASAYWKARSVKGTTKRENLLATPTNDISFSARLGRHGCPSYRACLVSCVFCLPITPPFTSSSTSRTVAKEGGRRRICVSISRIHDVKGRIWVSGIGETALDETS